MVNPILYTIILLLVGEFIAINIYTRNFLASYIVVRAKRDSGVLLQIFGKRGVYFRPGTLSDDTITFKYSRKQKGTIKTKNSQFFRTLGVSFIMLEEGTDRAVTSMTAPTFTGERGADPIEYDYLLQRALHKPTIASPQEKIILIGLIVVVVITAFTLFKVLDIQTAISTMQTAQTIGAGANI